MTTSTNIMTQFATDVMEGLSAEQKTLKSKYFYDEAGDAIFQQIMGMPSYYLTRCELEIFETQTPQIFECMSPYRKPFNLIELGAGDGMKTKVLLRYFLEQGVDFTYFPVDISKHILEELTADLQTEFPTLVVEPLNMDYFEALAHMEQFTDRKNVAMFLGSNIGNFLQPNLERFFTKMATYFKPNDKLFLGVDLKKDPHVIIDAYSDKEGITANFNYNLLNRMNRELGANFDLSQFKHYAMYEPVTGEARSYLVSLKKQMVQFSELDFEAQFEAGECIHTEISRKYDVKGLNHLAEKCGFTTEKNFFDTKQYYVNTMWQV